MKSNKLTGMIRPDLQALPQIGNRMTFLYLEHCQLNREDSAITVCRITIHMLQLNI